MTPKAIVFVGNEHTFFSALTALKSVHINTSDVLLFVNSSAPSKEIISHYSWLSVKFLFEDNDSIFLGRLKRRFSHLLWGVRAKKHLDKLDTSCVKHFIAAHYDWVSHVSCYHSIKNQRKSFLVIDDGMKNIVMEYRRCSELSEKRPNVFRMGAYSNRSYLEQKIIKCACRFLSLNCQSVPVLHWFTKLPISSFRNISNDQFYDISASPTNFEIDSQVLHFISQPLLGRGNLDDEMLSRIFAAIRDSFDESIKIMYMPHRSEASTQVELAGKFFEIGDRPSEPYEVLFDGLDKKPWAILSFYSSVLFTLHKMSDLGVKFYSINVSGVDMFDEGNVKIVYGAISKSSHVKLLRMDFNDNLLVTEAS